MDLRSKILKKLYRLFPFELKGDGVRKAIPSMGEESNVSKEELEVSCVINCYGRIRLLEGILYSLAEQDFPKENFEIVLVEDRGGTREGAEIAKLFKDKLNIRYFPLDKNFGKMGYSRNVGWINSKGKYILFLDDDTVILQKDFLTRLVEEFKTTSCNAIVPFGSASYCLIKGRYHYHDPYFPTNRCMAYKREVLEELGGFVSDIIGQEDVELVIRFIASGKKFHYSDRLFYFHPPLIYNDLNKGKAVGISFARLKHRYPPVVWLAIIINSSRFLPLILFPFNQEYLMKGRFSLGFLLGVIEGLRGRMISYR